MKAEYLLRKYLRKKYFFNQANHYTLKWINFEFSSGCNLRCKWCTLDHSKKKIFMSERILEKCLKELSKNKDFSLERIDLHNAGETLLHPKLELMLSTIAKWKRRIKGQPTIHLLTNAVLLTEEKTKKILENEVVDEVRFSVDGGTGEAYEEIRFGAKWEIVKKNILNFLELNKNKVRTEIICMIPEDKPLTLEWMDADFRDLLKKVDRMDLRRPYNWDGSKKLDLKNPFLEQSNGQVCKFLLKNLVVLPNGDVTVCCADLNSRGVVGSLKKNSLEEIFLSQKRFGMLNLFFKGLKKDIELCKYCAGYYDPV